MNIDLCFASYACICDNGYSRVSENMPVGFPEEIALIELAIKNKNNGESDSTDDNTGSIVFIVISISVLVLAIAAVTIVLLKRKRNQKLQQVFNDSQS